MREATLDPSPPYTGPRPSPARQWAPWLIATNAAAALCSAVLCVLNLVERDLLDQVATGQSSPRSQIHSVLSTIETTTNVFRIIVLASAVTSIAWAISRRSRTRLRQGGESSVEPHLARVWPFGFWCNIATVVLVAFLIVQARDARRHAVSAADFVEYRTYLAAIFGLFAAANVVGILLVRRATKLQDRREATSSAAKEEPTSALNPSSNVESEVRAKWLMLTFAMIIAFAVGVIFLGVAIGSFVTGEPDRATGASQLVVSVLLFAGARQLFRIRKGRVRARA